MTEDQFNQNVEDGKVIPVKAEQPAPQSTPRQFDENEPLLDSLRRPRRHLTSAPTFTPKTFSEQIQFVDDDGLKVYFYINGTWGFITLT